MRMIAGLAYLIEMKCTKMTNIGYSMCVSEQGLVSTGWHCTHVKKNAEGSSTAS